jgi:hypothetical protein
MKQIFVKPAGDIPVRDPGDPVLKPLPPEGSTVPQSSYWLRRIADGDVVKTTAEAIAKAVEAKAKTAQAAEAPAEAKSRKEK